MPELPEVETVRKGLSKRLLDFQIENLEVCRERAIASPGGSKVFIKMMRGASIGEWHRRGKYLIAKLYRRLPSQTNKTTSRDSCDASAGYWGVHLRMTGQFQWIEEASNPCPHTRVRFWNKEGKELRFVDTRSFAEMWWVSPKEKIENIITGLKNLGPEPFSPEFNAKYLLKKLQGKKRSIKSALLDQSIVAGAGNIYSDECLFLSGINPKKESGLLTEVELQSICSNLIEVLRISIGKGGTTFSDFRDLEGINGNYGGQAWVYRRTKKSCRKCGAIIQREKLSGRSTHWCPECQA